MNNETIKLYGATETLLPFDATNITKALLSAISTYLDEKT